MPASPRSTWLSDRTVSCTPDMPSTLARPPKASWLKVHAVPWPQVALLHSCASPSKPAPTTRPMTIAVLVCIAFSVYIALLVCIALPVCIAVLACIALPVSIAVLVCIALFVCIAVLCMHCRQDAAVCGTLGMSAWWHGAALFIHPPQCVSGTRLSAHASTYNSCVYRFCACWLSELAYDTPSRFLALTGKPANYSLAGRLTVHGG